MSDGRGSAGRALLALYAVLALAAGARAAVQLATDPGRAPLAYGLSAAAAAVYLLAGLALARSGRAARRAAAALCSLELAGVLAVGTLSVFDGERFPEATVGPATARATCTSAPAGPRTGLAGGPPGARRGAAVAEGPGKGASHMLDQ